MTWNALQSKQKITAILDHLTHKKTEIRVQILGEKETFHSKILKYEHGEASPGTGKRPQMVIEKLIPANGNPLVQSSLGVSLEFPVNENLCRCAVKFLGISTEYPFFGLILSFPEAVELKDKRREERFTYESPEFISVEFILKKGAEREKRYSMNIIDSSLHGLGILLTPKDAELLDMLKPGDKIPDITFYAQKALIRVDGTVKHISPVDRGKYKGCCILGIESKEIIISSQPIPSST